jgi:hypothetical protein
MRCGFRYKLQVYQAWKRTPCAPNLREKQLVICSLS